MTYDAQFALRRVIENYTHNTRFCLICNYISKIIPALQSRCITLRFSNIDNKEAIKKLKEICNIENVKYNNSGLQTITKLCEGDMRRCINLLQSVAMTNSDINSINVYKFTDKPNETIFKEAIDILTNRTFEESYNYLTNLKIKYNICLTYILRHLIALLLKNNNIPDNKLSNLIINLGILEKNISNNGEELIQICGLISYFHELKC